MAGQKTAVFAAFFEIHIHDFEGHFLGAIVAHHGGGLHLAEANLQAQLNGSSRSEVTADGGEAAAQAGGLNLQPATFFEIQANGANGLLQPDALVPALANEARLRGNLERRKHQVFFADAALSGA